MYTVIGAFVWYEFHESGVHATIAGVILGVMTPARAHVGEGLFRGMLDKARRVFEGEGWSQQSHRAEKVRNFGRAARETISPLEYLEHTLHPWVGFAIMPVFALANAGVPIQFSALGDKLALAVIAGLVIGKPIGILGFSWAAVKTGLAPPPKEFGWGAILAGGFLAGIGFTMALFIAGLALGSDLLDTAKIGVLFGSLISAVCGFVLMLVVLPKSAQ